MKQFNSPLTANPSSVQQEFSEGRGSGGGMWNDPISRRRFLKRSGGASVATLASWHGLSPVAVASFTGDSANADEEDTYVVHTVTTAFEVIGEAPGSDPNGQTNCKLDAEKKTAAMLQAGGKSTSQTSKPKPKPLKACDPPKDFKLTMDNPPEPVEGTPYVDTDGKWKVKFKIQVTCKVEYYFQEPA